MNFEDFKKAYDFVLEKWHYSAGLLVSLLAEIATTFWLLNIILKDSPIKRVSESIWYIQIIVAAGIGLIIVVVWFYSRRYPKRSKDKIGILVALRDDTKDANRIKKEIIERLEQTIKETSSGDMIETSSIDNFRAKHITDPASAIKLSDKTKYHFVIYGKMVNFAGQVESNLQFLVRHRPLQLKEKQRVQQGFTEALVNKNWWFLEKDTINGIKVTAQNIREIALYVIGIAAHQSYDFETSHLLHEDLLNILKEDPTKRNELNPIYKGVYYWISEAYTALALIAFYQTQDVPLAVQLNVTALTYQSDNDAAILNQALYLFEQDDVPGAKRCIRTLQKRNSHGSNLNGAWHYSDAFISFYENKYERGLRAYKKAFRGRIPDFTYKGVIGYLKRYIVNHPEQVQFNFALAHILITNENNYPEALKYLESFCGSDDFTNIKYIPLIGLARQYLNDAYKTIGIPPDGQITITS